MAGNDILPCAIYPQQMPRRSASQFKPDWFLPEWMASKQVTQAEMARRCGWSKATMNDIYHGKTAYYRDILNIAADALHLEPHELLMSPARANKARQLEGAFLQIAAEDRRDWHNDNPVQGAMARK
jgi:transcriptional regulator with XRE-family HTH domain